jgi:hypothetical protein
MHRSFQNGPMHGRGPAFNNVLPPAALALGELPMVGLMAALLWCTHSPVKGPDDAQPVSRWEGIPEA